jgi:hypothetical protein
MKKLLLGLVLLQEEGVVATEVEETELDEEGNPVVPAVEEEGVDGEGNEVAEGE